jgi:hypothetical protein
MQLITLISFVALFTSVSCCNDNFDCKLNGVCRAGACVCNKGWTSDDCSQLNFGAFVPLVSGYGVAPNHTTWGGNVLFDGALYHMYVAEMINNCSLTTWGTNSRCVHAVSNTLQGPFIFQDVAIDIWCHNPEPHAFSNSSGTYYAIFHIGNGTPNGAPKNCTMNQYGEVEVADADFIPESAASPGTLHVSGSPYGPWVGFTGPNGGNCNNPSALQVPNGTWAVLCDSTDIYTSSAIEGPWTKLVSVSTNGGVDGTYEDGFLYQDVLGNFHILYHVYSLDFKLGWIVSGHAYSEDLIHWTQQPTQPFPNWYMRDDGTNVTISTRERPKLFLNDQNEPIALMNGVCSALNCSVPPVNCKYDFWDYTLVAMIA